MSQIHDFRSESSKKQAFASGVNRFSTREKKQQKVQGIGRENDAERLYHELPDSHFTRSISNPEIVMQKRRESKLQKKLDEIHSSDRGPDAGQSLLLESWCFVPTIRETLIEEILNRGTLRKKKKISQYSCSNNRSMTH